MSDWLSMLGTAMHICYLSSGYYKRILYIGCFKQHVCISLHSGGWKLRAGGRMVRFWWGQVAVFSLVCKDEIFTLMTTSTPNHFLKDWPSNIITLLFLASVCESERGTNIQFIHLQTLRQGRESFLIKLWTVPEV
jgi:hypothetical protein